MKELSLEEIKKTELDILIHFREFCKANNISFFLSNGTLLGAVKYRGFIPWDDDIDVLVPRDDYERLVKLYTDSDKYKLFSPQRTEKFGYPFAKLSDMTTRKKESDIDNGISMGVDIDIFPIDAWDDDFEVAKKEVKKVSFCMMLLFYSKSRSLYSKNFFKKLIEFLLLYVCRVLGNKFFIKKIDRIAISHNTKNKFSGCKSWPVYGEREIIPAEAFSKAVDVTFEGESFPAPIGYDIYLRSLYGNYHQDPPKEAQKTHHSFEAFQFDC